MTAPREQLEAANASLLAFTRVLTPDTEETKAGPLRGQTFAVKDLFDVAGLPTTAGSKAREARAPAAADAVVVHRLKAAGARLVATANMDEYAYGFVTQNAHYGTTRNPFDPGCLAGGSSGGSAAAVSAGLVDFALGSDTNGSVRIPASLCGVYGLRPTHGRLPMDGVFPFVHRLDTVGAFARSVSQLKSVHEVMADVSYAGSASGLRVARLGGWFDRGASEAARLATERVLDAAGGSDLVTLPLAEAARSAAFLITAHEGGRLHKQTLIDHPDTYDPATRDRLIAGALLGDEAVEAAAALAEAFAMELDRLFDRYDVLLSPTVPGPAPRADQATMLIDGVPVDTRKNLGLYTQPISLAGVPALSVPAGMVDGLPIGAQMISRQEGEGTLFALAAAMEADGVIGAPRPPFWVGGD